MVWKGWWAGQGERGGGSAFAERLSQQEDRSKGFGSRGFRSRIFRSRDFRSRGLGQCLSHHSSGRKQRGGVVEGSAGGAVNSITFAQVGPTFLYGKPTAALTNSSSFLSDI